METRKFLVINEKGQHEYNIVVEELGRNNIKYYLHLSDNTIWSETHRGRLVLTMWDGGDGLTFDKELQAMDYALATYVRILMTFMEKTFSISSTKYKVIEETAIFEL